jgi:thiol-disulfide isomerase/thioredoxin
MSKRNTYLLGGAAIAVGIALIVIALTALSGDEDGGTTTSAPQKAERPTPPERSSTPPQQEQGDAPAGNARGRALSEAVAQRRPVRAPGFAVELVKEGSAPTTVRPLAQAVAGGSLALARLRGSPVVLHLFSSRCGPCRGDARLVETTWRRFGRRGVAFIGMSVGDSKQAAERFASAYDLSYPIARDAAGRVADAYGVTALPQTIFISGNGDVVGQVTGSVTVGQMQQGAAAAVAGRTIGSLEGAGRVPRR